MPTLECSAVRESGVTLVEARLASDDRRRVAVETTHDGPVWPPRREGVPATGWSDDGWAGVVPAAGTVALGYTTPEDVAGPPLRIAGSGPPDKESDITAQDVIRSLGDGRPPRDAIGAATAPDTVNLVPDDSGGSTTVTAIGPSGLDAVAARLDRAEALARADSVDSARRAVEEAGGMAAVRDLATQLEQDRERLAKLGRQVADLRARAAVEVPVEDLARLT